VTLEDDKDRRFINQIARKHMDLDERVDAGMMTQNPREAIARVASPYQLDWLASEAAARRAEERMDRVKSGLARARIHIEGS
jgi:hypothetical protein